MNQSDLVEEIHLKSGIPRTKINTVINLFFSAVADSLCVGNPVFIRGFGTFESKRVSQHMVRDFAANKSYPIPAHYEPGFRPSDALRSRVRNEVKP